MLKPHMGHDTFLHSRLLGGASGTFPGLDQDLLGLTSLGGGESCRGPYTGIKALMLAVLDNGIQCYLSRMPRVRTEAELWVNALQHRSPFSFPVVCETLGLEPDAVRAELKRWRAAETPARAVARRRPNVSRTNRTVVRDAG